MFFLSNIVTELNIKAKEDFLCDVSHISNPVEGAIEKYKNHPSIQMIKERFGSNKTFSFDLVLSDTIFKEIVSLNTKQATVMMYQPRLSKQMLICSQFLYLMLLMNLSFLAIFCLF